MQLDPEQIDWQIINDGVMGGRSRSSFSLDPEGLHFRGTLSTAFGGGFASIRGRLPQSLGSFRGFRLDLHGDGRRYQLRLRESSASNDIAWRAFIDSSGSRETIRLSVGDFEPVIRGRRIMALPGLSDRTVRYIGFMLASDEEGRFALSVHSMATLEAEDGHA